MQELNLLDWDSAFWQRKILDLSPTSLNSINKEYFQSTLRCIDTELVQCCIDINTDSSGIYVLENFGFHFVDLRVILQTRIEKLNFPKRKLKIRKAVPDDLPNIISITNGIFSKDSRYNWKGLFPKNKIDVFYNTWMKNSVVGNHDDAAYVAYDNDKILGVVTIKHLKNDVLRMGIMGIDAAQQGKGVGTELTSFCADYAKEHDCKILEAITEGRNILTQNFHIKNGLRIHELKSWYYYTNLIN